MISFEQQLNEAITFIKNNDQFLVVSHINPDGDTISSTLAMALILQGLGKTFTIANEDQLPSKFNFLPLYEKFKIISDINHKFSNVITLDVADQKRTGDISQLIDENSTILNIDHHPTNDDFGDINVVLSSAAATAEVMYDLIKQMNFDLNQEIATCIYTGLLTDTGGFRYSNTTAKVMRIASELLEYDISPGFIAEIALETITLDYIKILKIALEHLEIVEKGHIAWTYLTLENLESTGALSADTEGVVNYTRNIDGVEVGIFFKQTTADGVKVSLRSKRHVDVGLIAKKFGGGGHARAAGFSYNGNIDDVKKQLLLMLKDAKGWDALE